MLAAEKGHKTMNITLYVAYNTDGDCESSTDGAQEALDLLIENYGHAEGVRVVELALTLPQIKTLVVAATIPDVDGPITVTVA